jgi:hypothetical protein
MGLSEYIGKFLNQDDIETHIDAIKKSGDGIYCYVSDNHGMFSLCSYPLTKRRLFLNDIGYNIADGGLQLFCIYVMEGGNISWLALDNRNSGDAVDSLRIIGDSFLCRHLGKMKDN